MKKTAPILSLLLFGLIAGLAFIPGCDELVTNEIVNIDTIIVERDTTCFTECHGDYNNVIKAAQLGWVVSAHARTNPEDSVKTCGPECHTESGFLEALTDSTHSTPYYQYFSCRTCHTDPHAEPWKMPVKIRFDGEVTLVDNSTINKSPSNICFLCHQAIISVDSLVYDSVFIDQSWINKVAHGFQDADNWFGVNGYHYPGVTYASSHRLPTTRACVDCHMDEADGVDLGGHSFSLEDNGYLHLASCNTGCHGGAMTADSILALQSYLQDNLDSLKFKLISKFLLHPVTQLPTMTIIDSAGDAGAIYNYYYVLNDLSGGMHNYVYDTMLIRSSLNYLFRDTVTAK
jgi:hypothetical protein